MVPAVVTVGSGLVDTPFVVFTLGLWAGLTSAGASKRWRNLLTLAPGVVATCISRAAAVLFSMLMLGIFPPPLVLLILVVMVVDISISSFPRVLWRKKSKQKR